MSAAKARLRTYHRIVSLLARLPDSPTDFNFTEVRKEISEIAEQWRLDADKLASISGIPRMVVMQILGKAEPPRQQIRANTRPGGSELSYYADCKKLLNGLHVWVTGSDLEVREAENEERHPGTVEAVKFLKSLGTNAHDYLNAGVDAFVSLEQEICNVAKVNQVEFLSELAKLTAAIRDTVPKTGMSTQVNQTNEKLQHQIELLQQRLDEVVADRDRLASLLDKSLANSPFKTGFFQTLGSMPLMACLGFAGSIWGAENAAKLIDYLDLFVSSLTVAN